MSGHSRQRVSVGIPVYNEAAHIREAVLSVTPQAGEIIIFDNASTDGTSNICLELAGKYPHIRYERRTQNAGAVQNFLSCLDAATGDFFMFLGGHDRIASDYIAKCTEVLATDADCAMAFGKAIHISNSNEVVSEYVYDYGEELNDPSPVSRVLSFMRNLCDCTCYHGICRRHIFLEAHRDIYACSGADHIVLCKVAAAARMRYVDSALYFRRDKHGDETEAATRERLREAFQLSADAEALLDRNAMCMEQLAVLEKLVAPSPDANMTLDKAKRILAMRFGWKVPIENRRVSVVIPAYNRANHIGRAVRSVLEQTCPVAEIIIVDDCSTDDTAEAALQACPTAKIVRMPQNQGAQAARAAGIQAATEDWIAFLDSDDWWLPQKLEWQWEKAQEGFSVVHGPGLIRRSGQDDFFAIPPLEGDIYADLLRQPAPFYQCLLVRRECFEKVGYPDPAITSYQEWDMSLLLARHYPFGYVDKPLFVYEVQDDSISKDDYRSLRGYEQIVCKWWKEILQTARPEAGLEHYRILARQAYGLTGIYGYMHYRFLGCRLLNKSFAAVLLHAILSAIRSAPARCKHTLAQKAPWLRTLWRRMRGRRET